MQWQWNRLHFRHFMPPFSFTSASFPICRREQLLKSACGERAGEPGDFTADDQQPTTVNRRPITANREPTTANH
jgi:hypothetical protein